MINIEESDMSKVVTVYVRIYPLMKHSAHSTCTVNIVCVWQHASIYGRKSRTQAKSERRTTRAPQRCAERARAGKGEIILCGKAKAVSLVSPSL